MHTQKRMTRVCVTFFLPKLYDDTKVFQNSTCADPPAVIQVRYAHSMTARKRTVVTAITKPLSETTGMGSPCPAPLGFAALVEVPEGDDWVTLDDPVGDGVGVAAAVGSVETILVLVSVTIGVVDATGVVDMMAVPVGARAVVLTPGYGP